MKRHVLLLATVAAMLAIAAVGSQKKPRLLVLEWASKAKLEAPPVAVLIEMGLKDAKPRTWANRATVTGARVVHREGYRFRDGDRLIDPDAWQASSHRPLRLPPKNPAAAKTERLASVGVVLHLAEVQPDAVLTLDAWPDLSGKTTVPLKDVLGGRPKYLLDEGVVVRLVSTATPVVTDKTEDDFPAAAYGPDGTLWLAYVGYHVRDENRRIEQRPLKEQPADFKAFYTPDFRDQVFVKYFRDGKWSEPIAITDAKQDIVRCAIAVDGKGQVWVTYSANRNDKHDIYARPIDPGTGASRLGREEKLTREPGRYLNPVMCTDGAGKVMTVWQTFSEDAAPQIQGLGDLSGDIRPRYATAGGPTQGKLWYPCITTGTGEARVAFDSYLGGDYDIFLQEMDAAVGDRLSYGTRGVAGSSRFEARPSICSDAKGHLWIAYEEGPEKWGKDYGALDAEDGNPLYNARHVRVVCLDADGKLKRPTAELPVSRIPKQRHPNEQSLRYAYPKIGIDGKGRVWLTYRQKGGTRYTTHPGSYWLTFARRLDGDHWSEPIELHHSDGLLDSRPVLLPHAAGGLLVIHNTDGRYTTPERIDNDIYMSYVDLPGDPIEPELVPHDPGKKDEKLEQRNREEQAAVQRIRDYRAEVGGKKYQLLRGEFHRHTEISWDGGPDGSLEDMFRYAIDAAALDWVGNADHDNGAGREYSWWLTQKLTDAYHVPKAFTPMFAYERSVVYPHGHRNCIFAKRGVLTLPRLREPDPEKRVPRGPNGIHADDTKMLYRYLKELDGVCASHTSATGMGTDWRDNDPEVEPIVEIYQGDRMSYEYEGAPRSGYDPKSNKLPAQIGGWKPDGFIDHALKDKGYRLGFQSSSDHWSTHISYCVVLSERHDREAILEALKRRRSYAATDNIILDVRSGNHLMGEEFRTGEPPALQIHVVGTNSLAKVEVLKDSEVVATFRPDGREYRGTWTDPKPAAGTHYYYVRVQQADEELAWASPLRIDYRP
jgi:hypothetical protein